MERDSLIYRESVKAQMNTGVTGLDPVWRKRRIQTRAFQKQFEPMSGGSELTFTEGSQKIILIESQSYY